MCLFTCQKCKTTINQRETGTHVCEVRADEVVTDAEVRKAKAEALREAADSVHDNAASPYCLPCHRDDADLLRTIAAEYETGDQA